MASHLQRDSAFCGSLCRRPLPIVFYLLACCIVAALCGGCQGEHARNDAATWNGRYDEEHPLVTVDQDRVVHAEPNVLHPVRVRLRNTSRQTVVGATARLPCSCHIVDALPQEFPPDGTFDTTFKVLIPWRGSERYEIEFYDGSHNLAGVAAFQIEVSGAVPEIVRVPPSIQLIHISREQKLYTVELDAVEESGAAALVEAADFGDQPGIVALPPRRVHSKPLNQNFVLQRYQVPVKVEATEEGDFAAKLRVHVAGVGDHPQIPVQVRVLPRAHISPSAIEFPATSAAGETAAFRVVTRVEGDEYLLNSVDRDLLSIEASDAGDSKWVVTCQKPASVGLSTRITLTSTAGDTIVLPVKWQ